MTTTSPHDGLHGIIDFGGDEMDIAEPSLILPNDSGSAYVGEMSQTILNSDLVAPDEDRSLLFEPGPGEILMADPNIIDLMLDDVSRLSQGYYSGHTYHRTYSGGEGWSGFGGTGGGGGFDSSEYPDEDSTSLGPYEYCRSTQNMTPAELEDYLVASEAAEIAREIAAKPDRDKYEYGSIIYRDANGVITHTEVVTQHNPTAVALSTVGMPNWGSALGFVHSHVADGYDPNFPGGRLYPTPSTGGSSDWSGFNTMQKMIVDDLTANRGYSAEAALAQANEFVQFVYGAAGPSGSGAYELNRFDETDEQYQLKGVEQLNYAEWINPNLGPCGS